MPASVEHKRIHPIRIVIAVIIGVILLAVAVTMYRNEHTKQPPAPTKSTQQMQPNTPQNTPPGGY